MALADKENKTDDLENWENSTVSTLVGLGLPPHVFPVENTLEGFNLAYRKFFGRAWRPVGSFDWDEIAQGIAVATNNRVKGM